MSDPIQHLRELLANVPSGAWRVDKRGLPAVYAYAPDDKNDIPSVLMYQGDARVHKVQLIVAAINTLPALLDVAEAARKVNAEYDHERGKRGSDCPCLPSIECDLTDALAKLEKKP